MPGNLEKDAYQQYEGQSYEVRIAEGTKMRGKGVKILTPEQMLSRLPISLAQLQAGNK